MGVAMDLGGLTGETGARPFLNIPPYSWPHRAPTDDTVGSQDAGAVEGVVGREHVTAVLARDVWVCRAT